MERDRNSSEITRRAAIAAAAGAVLTGPVLGADANSENCRIGPAPHSKGPRVFLDYDQIELDAAYNQFVYAPLGAEIQARWRSNSEETRRRLGAPRRESYGPSAIEKLDIFRTSRANAPVIIYVHGGAWITEEASGYHFAAENMTGAGAHYVALDFAPVNALNGDLRVMSDQVRRGIAWVHKNVATFGGDPNRIFVCGHSSGAHLAGVALITDWQKDYGLPADIIKGGVLLSGLYEMKPVRLSSRGTYVKFDDTMEDSMSAIRHIDRLRAPLTLLYGTNETPEFQRQTREFAAAVKAAGKPVTLIAVPNANHFEMEETLANPYGWGGRAALAMMGLAKA
jgi:arylformamidase